MATTWIKSQIIGHKCNVNQGDAEVWQFIEGRSLGDKKVVWTHGKTDISFCPYCGEKLPTTSKELE